MLPMTPSDRLRVVIASTQQLWHGGEKQAALLAEGLRRRGHDCHILARQGGLFAAGMRAEGFAVSELPGRGRSLPALVQCRRVLRQITPDVVFSNDSHALTATGLASIGLAIPLRVAARRVDFAIRSRAKFLRFSDGVVCVSRGVADVCRAAGMGGSHLQVVHDGVPPAFAESGCRERGRTALSLVDAQKLLLVVAKLTDHKGHRFLLEGLPAVLAEHPEAVLALAGDGELREELEQQARSLGLLSHVRFLGYRDDVPDLLAAADVVVQPSHLEGLCSSLIDAMLAARPIVATRAGGIPDLLDVSDSESDVAWLVPTKCPESLSQSVCAALRQPEVAATRGYAARERALRHFTDDIMVENTLAAFRHFRQRRRGKAA